MPAMNVQTSAIGATMQVRKAMVRRMRMWRVIRFWGSASHVSSEADSIAAISLSI
jgi:hypothetical protein